MVLDAKYIKYDFQISDTFMRRVLIQTFKLKMYVYYPFGWLNRILRLKFWKCCAVKVNKTKIVIDFL